MTKLLREYYSLCEGGVCQDYLTESEKAEVRNNGAMYLTGVLQRADVRNGNGRVYPERVLRREVENYKKLIRERRSIGECVDKETQIMTKEGWKYFEEISDNEEVFVLDTDTSEIRLENIIRKIEKPFKGNLLHFSNEHGTLDMMVTPNHKVQIYDRKGKIHNLLAEEVATRLYEKDSFISHSSIRKNGGKWKGVRPEFIEFSGKKINPEVWAAFLGFYIAEGCCPKNHGNKIQITQKKEEEKRQFEDLLKSFPFEFSKNTREDGLTVDYLFYDQEMREYLSALGKSYEKRIPEEVKNWSPELLDILVEWLLLGDGRNRKRRNGLLHRELYTTSPKLAEDVSEIFYKLNSSCNIQTRRQKNRLIEGRMIKEENSRLLYIVSEQSAKNIWLDPRMVSVQKVPYEDNVYCVETSTGNWLMKRNGHACWTHNCDHPDDSVVNLKNASHMVVDIWWEGKDVMGKIKVLKNTPSGQILEGLVKDGVQLGISSRGLGSVREEMGNTVVEDDFQLLCFDMVSEPSTQNAFMTLRESRNHTNIFTKADKIHRALNDILGGF